MKQRRVLALSIILCALALSVCSYTLSVLLSKQTIYASGTVIESFGIDLYHDPICAFSCKQILWGELYPSSSKNVEIYVKNTGISACQIVLDTDSWIPKVAEDYIFLTWDYDDSPILPSRVKKVILTMKISRDIWGIDSFQMKISVSAT